MRLGGLAIRLKRAWTELTIASAMVASALLLSSCMVKAPKVSSTRMLASFDHQNVTSCVGCHASNRPLGVVGNPVSFDHAINGGQGDCISCHTPNPSNLTWAGGRFSHNPKPSTCVSCHENDRPSSTSGWVAYNSSLPFDYATHGSGADCVSCHTTVTSFSASKDWAGGKYVHTSGDTSCLSCHSSTQWPSGTGPFVDANGNTVSSFDHLVQGTGDCAGCHQKALTYVSASTPNYTWSRTGIAYPRTLAAITDPDPDSTDITATTSVPVWSGTSITSATTSSTTVHQTMNHLSIEVSSATLQNCSNCHSNASSGSYRPGYFHANIPGNIPTQPVTCGDCHGAGTLYPTGASTNGMPTGLTGVQGLGRSPATPEMNHFAQTWSKSGSSWVHNSTAAFNQDCSVCHNNPGGSWSGANFHTSLAQASQPQPASCLDCHANNRPSGAVPASPSASTPTKFDHSNGMGDCVSCHAAPTNTSASSPPSVALWAGGVFHTNAGAQTSCSTCHAAQRPTNTSGWVSATYSNAPFIYSTHGGSLDCATCHSSTNSFTSMSGWQGGRYVHSSGDKSCNSCHSNNLASWYPNAGSITQDHTNAGDCIGCHVAALTNVIAQGSSPSNAAWVNTGTNGLPPGLSGSATTAVNYSSLNSAANPITQHNQVSSVSTGSEVMPEQILHSSSSIPSSHYSNGSLVCTDCHTSTTDYSSGLFHTNPATHTLWAAQPTSCKDCHLGTMPSGIVGAALHSFDHSAVYTSGTSVSAVDCATCHTQVGGSGNWAIGSFHAKTGGNTPKTCTTCHYLDVQSDLSATVNHMAHSSSQVTQDCATCHAQPTAAQISAGGYPTANLWSGASYHSKISSQPTACADCHSPSDLPTGTKVSAVDSNYTLKEYMNHGASYASGNDCKTCHKSELSIPAGSSPTAWSTSTSFHTGVTAGVTTCTVCHGTSNGNGSVFGTGNTIPAGVTVSSTVSSVGNVGAVITPYYNSPAVGQPIYAGMNHADGNASASDCVLCHSVPPANAGTGKYSLWQNGKFHSHVSNPAVSGKCLNCHGGEMPNASFTGFDHTSLVTSSVTNFPVPNNPGSYLTKDCGGCHVTNVGTNWLGASVVPPTITLGPWTSGSSITSNTVVLPHPAANTYTSCTQCHAGSTYTQIIDYNHDGLTSGVTINGSSPASQPNLGTTVYNATTNPTFCVMCHNSSSPYINNSALSSALSANITSGSKNVVTSTTSALVPGMSVTGTGIPSGARISSISADGVTFTLSAAATASATGTSLVVKHVQITQASIGNHKGSTATQDCTSCHAVGGSEYLAPPTPGVFSTGVISGN